MNKILCILIIIILLFLCCILLLKLLKKTNGPFYGGDLIPLQNIVSPELMIHYISARDYKLFTFNLYNLFLNIPICANGKLEEIFMKNVTITIDDYINKENKQLKDYKRNIRKYITKFPQQNAKAYIYLKEICTVDKLKEFVDLKLSELKGSKNKIDNFMTLKQYVDNNLLFKFFKDCFERIILDFKRNNENDLEEEVKCLIEAYTSIFSNDKYLKTTLYLMENYLNDLKKQKLLGNGPEFVTKDKQSTYINLNENDTYYLMLKIYTFTVTDKKPKNATNYVCLLYSILREDDYKPSQNKPFNATPTNVNCDNLDNVYNFNGEKYNTIPHSLTLSYGDSYYKPISYEENKKHNYYGWLPIKMKFINYKGLDCFEIQEIIQGEHSSVDKSGVPKTFDTNKIPKDKLNYVNMLYVEG